MNNQNTPQHYQGTTQPIDLINAQNLNFNLGNVVKYVCRAGKKQGENVLSDLEKAQNYINYEIEQIKKNEWKTTQKASKKTSIKDRSLYTKKHVSLYNVNTDYIV